MDCIERFQDSFEESVLVEVNGHRALWVSAVDSLADCRGTRKDMLLVYEDSLYYSAAVRSAVVLKLLSEAAPSVIPSHSYSTVLGGVIIISLADSAFAQNAADNFHSCHMGGIDVSSFIPDFTGVVATLIEALMRAIREETNKLLPPPDAVFSDVIRARGTTDFTFLPVSWTQNALFFPNQSLSSFNAVRLMTLLRYTRFNYFDWTSTSFEEDDTDDNGDPIWSSHNIERTLWVKNGSAVNQEITASLPSLSDDDIKEVLSTTPERLNPSAVIYPPTFNTRVLAAGSLRVCGHIGLPQVFGLPGDSSWVEPFREAGLLNEDATYDFYTDNRTGILLIAGTPEVVLGKLLSEPAMTNFILTTKTDEEEDYSLEDPECSCLQLAMDFCDAYTLPEQKEVIKRLMPVLADIKHLEKGLAALNAYDVNTNSMTCLKLRGTNEKHQPELNMSYSGLEKILQAMKVDYQLSLAALQVAAV